MSCEQRRPSCRARVQAPAPPSDSACAHASASVVVAAAAALAATPARMAPSRVTGHQRRASAPRNLATRQLIVQFVINILLASPMLNNQMQPHASPLGAPAAPGCSGASVHDSSPGASAGVKFEATRGDKSSSSSVSSQPPPPPFGTQTNRRGPHWRWLLANELAPAATRRRHTNLLTIDDDDDDESGGAGGSDESTEYDTAGGGRTHYAVNENDRARERSRQSADAANEPTQGLAAEPALGSEARAAAVRAKQVAGAQSAASADVDLLKLKRRRRHRVRELDLGAGPSGVFAPGVGSGGGGSSDRDRDRDRGPDADADADPDDGLTSAQSARGLAAGKRTATLDDARKIRSASASAQQQPTTQTPLARQQIRTRERIQIAEQAMTKKLMELKQKYMTNRAINDLAYYILLSIYALLITFGTISNWLICMTVILKPKILSPRNIFIVNLAGSDLLLCVFTMPFSFIEISMKMWQMGLIPCKLVSGLQATSIFVSTISITAIALDRYKVIVYPTHQEAASGARGAFLLLASVWISALLLSLPLFWFRTVEHYDNLLPQNGSLAHHGLRSASGQQAAPLAPSLAQQQQPQLQPQLQLQSHSQPLPQPPPQPPNVSATSLDNVAGYQNNASSNNGQAPAGARPAPVGLSALSAAMNQHDTIESIDFCVEAWPFAHGRGIYSVISMIIQYLVPITIVSVVYAKISSRLQKRLVRRQKLTQLECQQKRQLNLIRRTNHLLISVSLVFGLSWLPLNVLNVVSDFSPKFRQLLDDQSLRVIFAVCHLIGCSSACSNPVLYGFLNENFRKELRQVYNQYARRLVRLLRRLVCCRSCWLTRELARRCFGSRIDLADEDENEDENGAARRASAEKGDLALARELTEKRHHHQRHRHHHEHKDEDEDDINYEDDDDDTLSIDSTCSSSGSGSGSSVASSGSSRSSSGFASSSAEELRRTPLEQPQRPVSLLSLSVPSGARDASRGHQGHSLRSLPGGMGAQATPTPSPNDEPAAASNRRTGRICDPSSQAPTPRRASMQQSIFDAARRLSYQTIASSRHAMGGRTMRLCLCISGSSSADTLRAVGPASAQAPANGINMRALSPPASDRSQCGARDEPRKGSFEDDPDDGRRRRDRKRRRQRRRDQEAAQLEVVGALECQCQCHKQSMRVQTDREAPASEKFDSKSLGGELAPGRTADAGATTATATATATDSSTSGRRVWLRFLARGPANRANIARSSGDLTLAEPCANNQVRGLASALGLETEIQLGPQGPLQNAERESQAAQLHCDNCKHSSATSLALKRLLTADGQVSHKRPDKRRRRRRHRDHHNHHRRRAAKRPADSSRAPALIVGGFGPAIADPEAKAAPLVTLAAPAQRADRNGTSKRRPLMSSIMSSFRLTRSSASSQDGAAERHQHARPNADSGHPQQQPQQSQQQRPQPAIKLSALASSEPQNPGAPGEWGRPAGQLGDQQQQQQAGGGAKQVGTVYLSIELPRDQRSDSLVSVSREKSTSVVVLGFEEIHDDDDKDQDDEHVENKQAAPSEPAEGDTVFERDAEGGRGRELAPEPEPESSASARSVQQSPGGRASSTEAKDTTRTSAPDELDRNLDESVAQDATARSSASSSSTSSSFTSACHLHTSSLFSSCTCSSASSCQSSSTTNCHHNSQLQPPHQQPYARQRAAVCESELVKGAPVPLDAAATLPDCGRQAIAASRSGQDLKLGPGLGGVELGRATPGSSSPPLLALLGGSLHATLDWPRARSATTGSYMRATALAARASLIGRGYGARKLPSPVPNEAAGTIPSTVPAASTTTATNTTTTNLCSMLTPTSASRSSLVSCSEIAPEEGYVNEMRPNDASNESALEQELGSERHLVMGTASIECYKLE